MGLESNVFGSGQSDFYVPQYKVDKGYGEKDVYNRINEIYNVTVEKFVQNLGDGSRADLFSYDYLFKGPDGLEHKVHTDVTCKNGNLSVEDSTGSRTLCIPGPDLLERTKNYLTALYRDMGYMEFRNVKIH